MERVHPARARGYEGVAHIGQLRVEHEPCAGLHEMGLVKLRHARALPALPGFPERLGHGRRIALEDGHLVPLPRHHQSRGEAADPGSENDDSGHLTIGDTGRRRNIPELYPSGNGSPARAHLPCSAMNAYAVAHLRSVDVGPDIVRYLERIDDTLEPFGGRFIIHGGENDVLEGDWPGDLIVIEFPDRASATGWYESPAYQEILHLRTDNSDGAAIIVDGVPSDHRATDVLSATQR